MILVQTDYQLVRQFEQILRSEESSLKSARTKVDEAVGKTRIQLATEALKIVQGHQQQADDAARTILQALWDEWTSAPVVNQERFVSLFGEMQALIQSALD